MAMLAILILPLSMLGWTAAAAVIPSAVASTNNAGPHGFSEDPLRLHLANRQQRLGFCRTHGNTLWYNRHRRPLRC